MKGAPLEPGGLGRERGKVQRLPLHAHAVAAMVEYMWRAPHQCWGGQGARLLGRASPL